MKVFWNTFKTIFAFMAAIGLIADLVYATVMGIYAWLEDRGLLDWLLY